MGIELIRQIHQDGILGGLTEENNEISLDKIINKVQNPKGKRSGGTLIKKIEEYRALWELFTKKEKYDSILLDKYGGFSYYFSSQRSVFEPAVSDFLIKNELSPEYPEERKFAVCLTHDIDFVCPGMLNTAARAVKALRKGQFAQVSILPFSRINGTWSPLWNFRQIMKLEESYGAKSTFYFLTLDSRNEDFAFSIEELEGELGHISDRGWEVGLHGGHEAYNNPVESRSKKRNTTLFSQIHLDFNQAWKLTEKLIDTVERHKSVLTVLWHNTYMQGDYLEFYRKILQYSTQKGTWTVSGAEIYKWWKKNIENYCAG